jgi:hypothetical protein
MGKMSDKDRTEMYLEGGWKTPEVAHLFGAWEDNEATVEMFEGVDEALWNVRETLRSVLNKQIRHEKDRQIHGQVR